MGLIADLREKYQREGKSQHFEDGLSKAVDMITRQTSLSREEAAERLEMNGLNVLATIFEATGCTGRRKSESDNRSLHQRMYAEYRSMLDDASRRHTTAKVDAERRKRMAVTGVSSHTGTFQPPPPPLPLKTQKSEPTDQS